MKQNKKYLFSIVALLLIFSSCKQKEYALGDLTAPTNLVITTAIVGQDATHPNGDGSGDVKITITADNALSYKVDYDANTAVDLVYLPTGSVTKKFATIGVNTYRITAVAYGKGGTSSLITKDITVRFDYAPDPSIVANITGGTSKTWVVDKSVAGHFGVGPWSNTSLTPEWWAAGVNEKLPDYPCFYTSTFKFTKVSVGVYKLDVATPDGAFTKTGSNASIPGIPATGAEGCYSYGGGTSDFAFLPSTTTIPATTPSTKVSIFVGGTTTYIGYGSLQKEYEILVSTPTYLYLRVQGTETGNAWYIKLKAI